MEYYYDIYTLWHEYLLDAIDCYVYDSDITSITFCFKEFVHLSPIIFTLTLVLLWIHNPFFSNHCPLSTLDILILLQAAVQSACRTRKVLLKKPLSYCKRSKQWDICMAHSRNKTTKRYIQRERIVRPARTTEVVDNKVEAAPDGRLAAS